MFYHMNMTQQLSNNIKYGIHPELETELGFHLMPSTLS